MAEGFVILDNVFVPNERIFLDAAVQQAAVFAHSLGLWERLGGLSAMAEERDQLVRVPQPVPEANGPAQEGPIKEANAKKHLHAPLVRARLQTATANRHTTDQ